MIELSEAFRADCQQALALHQELGDRRGELNVLDSLGYIYHHLGHLSKQLAVSNRHSL